MKADEKKTLKKKINVFQIVAIKTEASDELISL